MFIYQQFCHKSKFMNQLPTRTMLQTMVTSGNRYYGIGSWVLHLLENKNMTVALAY